ncbi:hypothetical protein [Streptomyces flaveolus]|uniref:hypothetical protein n=1 Tax=Streptomyces flaveolus TaxID=67297 RepID=UPI00380C4887
MPSARARLRRRAAAKGCWPPCDKQVGLLMLDYPYDSIMAARVLGQGYASC